MSNDDEFFERRHDSIGIGKEQMLGKAAKQRGPRGEISRIVLQRLQNMHVYNLEENSGNVERATELHDKIMDWVEGRAEKTGDKSFVEMLKKGRDKKVSSVISRGDLEDYLNSMGDHSAEARILEDLKIWVIEKVPDVVRNSTLAARVRIDQSQMDQLKK